MRGRRCPFPAPTRSGYCVQGVSQPRATSEATAYNQSVTIVAYIDSYTNDRAFEVRDYGEADVDIGDVLYYECRPCGAEEGRLEHLLQTQAEYDEANPPSEPCPTCGKG